MKLHLPLLLSGFLLGLPWSPLRAADDASTNAVKSLNLGETKLPPIFSTKATALASVTLKRDDKAEGKPVRSVDLGLCDVTDAGLKELAALKQLQSLNLIRCEKVTDAGLKELAALKQLQSLDLRGCDKVTDAGLKELAALKQLQSLKLQGCKLVSNDGVDKLKRAIPKLQVFPTSEPRVP